MFYGSNKKCLLQTKYETMKVALKYLFFKSMTSVTLIVGNNTVKLHAHDILRVDCNRMKILKSLFNKLFFINNLSAKTNVTNVNANVDLNSARELCLNEKL